MPSGVLHFLSMLEKFLADANKGAGSLPVKAGLRRRRFQGQTADDFCRLVRTADAPRREATAIVQRR